MKTQTTSSRKPPRLRRTFPELDPARATFLRERNQRAFDEQPRLADLERRLLGLGGHTALLFTRQPYVEEILRRGRCMPGARAISCPGAPSHCHGNAATLYVLSKAAVWIATGYSLSDDGLWRQHSWGADAADGRVIETTVRSVRYYGYVLEDGDESIEFFLGNTDRAQFTSSENERIGRFIRGRISPELRARFLEAAAQPA